MSLPDQLTRLAQQLEDQHAPTSMTIMLREAALEIQRLEHDIDSYMNAANEYMREAEEYRTTLQKIAHGPYDITFSYVELFKDMVETATNALYKREVK